MVNNMPIMNKLRKNIIHPLKPLCTLHLNVVASAVGILFLLLNYQSCLAGHVMKTRSKFHGHSNYAYELKLRQSRT